MNPLRLPIAASQGIWMRARITMAPPAAGPTTGNVGVRDRPPVRLAVIGDSTAAGCGVDRHDDGFTGSLARAVSARTGRPVEWEVVGEFGATARRVRHRLLPRLGAGFDAAVLLAGANDAMGRRGVAEWADDLGAIVDDLLERAGRVVVAAVPPFELFPSMPATLGRYLSERGAALDEASRRVCAVRPAVTWVPMPGTPGPDFFSVDRFHPSAAGYRSWAGVVAGHLTL